MSPFDSFRYQTHAETQINNTSVIFPTTLEKFMQYYDPLGRLNYFTFQYGLIVGSGSLSGNQAQGTNS
jgi:hypothetical protein